METARKPSRGTSVHGEFSNCAQARIVRAMSDVLKPASKFLLILAKLASEDSKEGNDLAER